jgi:hypothetical protein
MTTLNPDHHKTYSDRSNARKGARRLVETGNAPASSFDIERVVAGRFEIIGTPTTRRQPPS